MSTVETGDLEFSGLDALILCDLINNKAYMEALITHRVEGEAPPGEPNNEPLLPKPGEPPRGYPQALGPMFEDVDDFHRNKAVEVATQILESEKDEFCPSEGKYVSHKNILDFLRRLETNERQRQALAYLVERFEGTIRNGTSFRTLQSLAMFIEYSVKAENADILEQIRDGETTTADIQRNRLMW